MSAAVLTRPVQSTHTCEVCRGAGGVFRGGRFPEACPNGCPPRIVRAYGCPDCGHLPGCGCDCCPYPMPAVAAEQLVGGAL